MRRRLLSLAMALAMALSLLPTAAWAEEEQPPAGSTVSMEPASNEETQGTPTETSQPVEVEKDVEGSDLADIGVQPPASNALQSDTSWTGSGTEGDPYQIANEGDLRKLAELVNGGNSYEGTYFLMTQDITLTSEWTPIGAGTRSGSGYKPNNSGAAFKGTFNGGGKTISGLKITSGSGDEAIGLFGVVDGGTVERLTLTNVSIDSDSECVGGAIGLMVNGATADQITVGAASGDSSSITAARGNGGIVGRMTISGTISNCINYATIVGENSGGNTGGIVGAAYYTGDGKEMFIDDCKNYGAVTGIYGVGGIVGLCAANVSGCTNEGEVTGSAASIGGIVAEQQNYGSVIGCTNSGDVTNSSTAYGTGGIVGWVRYSGVEASYPSKEIIEVCDNINYGSIDGGNDGGGIIGTVYNAVVATGNENHASSITATTFAAGVVGNLQFQETPAADSTGTVIPRHSIEVYNNISTTTDFSGTCQGDYVYHNEEHAGEGVVIEKDVIDNNGTDWVAEIEGSKYATLQGAIDAAEDGQTVKLLKDVTVTSDAKAGDPSNQNSAVTISKPITLDGDGKSIIVTENFAASNSILSVNNATGPVVIQNLKIQGPGEDADKVTNCLNIYQSSDVTVKDLTTSGGNGYGVVVNSSDVTIEGSNTNIGTGKWGAVNVGNNESSASLVVKDGTFDGLVYAQFEEGNGTSSIQISGGTFTGAEVSGTGISVYATDGASVQITGGAFTYEPNEEYLAPGVEITGGEGNWTVTYDDSIFTSGTGTATDPCIIPDVAHLKAFRDSVNEGNNYAGVYIALNGGTYDISDAEWEPIGITGSDRADHSFKGHFNGQGATISGLTMTGDDLACYNSFNTGYACYGFFGGVDGGTVENLIFAGFTVDTPGTLPEIQEKNAACNNTVAVAVGAAVNGAQIRNITVQSGSVTGHGRAAGVVGFVGADSNASTGGSVGNIVVEGCVNYAAVISNWTYSSHGTAGGICATYNTYSADSGSATFQNNTNYGSITGFYAGGILASTFAGNGDLILTGNRNHGAISAEGRKSYYTEKADDTTTLWTPSAAGIAVGVANATLTDNHNYASINGSDGYAGGITSTIDETSAFAGTNTNTGNITGWRAGGIAASADGGVTLGAGLSSGGTIAPVDLNYDVVDRYSDPAAIGGIVGVLGTKSVLDGAEVSSTASLNNTTNTPYAGTLVGCVQEGSENNTAKPVPTIVKNVSDDAAIGAVRIISNDPHHVQFENVHLSTLDAVATHNQEHTFTLTLEGSTIGTLAVDGAVHTGMTLEISGGTVEEVVFTHVTGNSAGTTAVKFAASDGAQIGTVDATDDSNNITYSGGLYVAAVGTSTIGEVRTTGPVTVGFKHADGDENSDGRDFPNTGTISAVVTSSTAYTIDDISGSDKTPGNVLYLVSNPSGQMTTMTGILDEGTNPAGYEAFTGVSLAADATATGPLTVAAGRTLVIEEGVTLDMNQKQLGSSGSIQNHGAITNLASESTPDVTTVVSFQVTPVNAKVVVRSSDGTDVSPVSVNEYHLEDGAYTYTVSLEGYVAQSGSFTVDGSAGRTITISLQPIPTPVPDDDDNTPSYSGGSSTPSYSNTIEVGDGGDVKVSPRTPEAGDTVTITPDPDAGYEVDEVIVTDRNGDAVRVTANRNGTYTFEQPRGRVTIEVTFVRTDSGLPFIDVAANAWYYDAVAYAYENGLMSGTASNLFSPNATTTRGMIVTMLYRLEGEPRVSGTSTFDDVADGVYYTDAVIWANANGIVTGYDDTTFGPNDAITREQMAAILYRYAQYKGYDTTQGGMAIREYADYEEISEYALTAMDWAVNAGLVTGTTSSTLTPDGSAVRAQVATIFMRFMEGVAE